MVEILTGDSIEYSFDKLNIDAKRTYRGKRYEVWEIAENEFNKLSAIKDEDWKEDYGWYRYAEGSVMGPTDATFMINNHEMVAWSGSYRLDLYNQWCDEDEKVHSAFYHSFNEYENYYMPRKYRTLTKYLVNELGASTESNVCALAVDLAKANGMTLAELFKTYEG